VPATTGKKVAQVWLNPCAAPSVTAYVGPGGDWCGGLPKGPAPPFSRSSGALRGLRKDRTVTSSGCVARAWRGSGARQALLARFLRGTHEHGLDADVSRKVGELCAAVGKSDVIDAHLALFARDDDVVLTSDVQDLRTLLRAAGTTAHVKRGLKTASRRGRTAWSWAQPVPTGVGGPPWPTERESFTPLDADGAAASAVGASELLVIDGSGGWWAERGSRGPSSVFRP